MRLFIAINLPAAERKKLHREAAALRERDLPVRWVEPDHYHVTLKFLGETDPDRVPDVEGVLEGVAGATRTFDMEMAGFGAFPTIRRPRVLWFGADPSPSLRCLKQDIEWGLAELGFPRETRAFHPHVTLGRASDQGAAGYFRGLDDVVSDLSYRASVPVKKIDLMRSHLSRSGPRYSVLSSTALKVDA